MTKRGTLFIFKPKRGPFSSEDQSGDPFLLRTKGGSFSSSNTSGDLFHLRTKVGTLFSSGPKGRPFSKYNSMNAWSPSKFTFESCRPLITRESILVPRTHALKTIWEWRLWRDRKQNANSRESRLAPNVLLDCFEMGLFTRRVCFEYRFRDGIL